MLSQVDKEQAAKRRRENWHVLASLLGGYNEFSKDLRASDVPLFYPFLLKNDELRQALNKQKIFTPAYWPGVEEKAPRESFDAYLARYMHPLPLDQRYSSSDMEYLANFVKKFLNGKKCINGTPNSINRGDAP